MFTSERSRLPARHFLVSLGAVSLCLSAPAFGDAFGTPATPDDVDSAFLTVMPDGANLPQGGGSAREGDALYQAHCASCHGTDGEGGLANRLVGGRGTLDTDEPVKTVGSYWPYATTAFDYIRRAMPYQAPMSLTNDEYYAITAWVLNRNDIIDADTRIDRRSLAEVEMPNRDGFVNAWPDIPAAYDYKD